MDVALADGPDAERAPRDIRGRLTLTRLPALSQVLVQLLELCGRDDVYLSDLATVISRDPCLAARILSLSNSAAFQGRSRPSTLEQCLSLLGMKLVKTVAISESVLQVFNRLTSGRDIDLREFWEHSLRSALIAGELARRLDYPNPEEAYLGGLMHDVGRLAMLATDPDGYRRMLNEHLDDEALCALEQKTFALNHAEVGAWLVEKWALNSFLSDCILYHHEPAERVAPAHPLVRIVLMANRLAHVREQELPPAVTRLLAECGLALEDHRGLLDQVDRQLAELAEQLGIDITLPAGNADDGDRQLAARLQDMLLVDQVLGGIPGLQGADACLRGVAQALKLLFEADGALWFGCTDGRGEQFRGQSLGAQGDRLSQLEFRRGGTSLLAQALEAGPMVALRDDRRLNVLDEQILRALGAEALLYVPLAAGRACRGILVAKLASTAQATALESRKSCLDYFARLGAQRLAAAGDAGSQETAPAAPAAADDRLNRLVHEIGNPLTIIRNYLAILESANARHGNEQPELVIVREEIDRVGKMLRSVKESEAARTAGPAPVNLNRLIEGLVALFRGSLPRAAGMEFQLELADGLPDIVSDGDRIKQLFLNLVKNAVEAMAGGGSIRIATALWGSGAEASHLQVSIEDKGPGIPREVLSHLYQPVASSKGQEHQGVGLAVVGQLVRELKGLINCRSDARGTTFNLLLPLDVR